jgi:uncharacterized membrane protein YesL
VPNRQAMRPAGKPREEPSEVEEPSGLGHVLRATLSQAWDYAHLVIAGSLLWGISLAAPMLATAFLRDLRVAVPLFYVLGALTVGPATVALYGMSEAMARRELPGLGAFFEALRRFYWRGAALFCIQAFVLGGVGLAAWFYRTMFDSWVLGALSLLWVYVGLFWVMMNLFVPALLVREDGSVRSALRNGGLLTLAHPGYTFVVMLQIAFLLLLVMVPVFTRSNLALGVSFLVFFLVLPGFVPLLATNAVNDLLRKHLADGSEKEGGEGEDNGTAGVRGEE